MPVRDTVDDIIGTDSTVDAAVDVDGWLERMRVLVSFEPETASVGELDAIGAHTTAVSGLVSSLRARCAARRSVLADAAATSGGVPVDHGDPDGGHARSNRQSARQSAKDRARAGTLGLLPALRRLLETGEIGVEHVDVVTAVLADLTATQQLAVRDRDREIAALAAGHSPDRFRTVLRQLLFRLLEQDAIARFERQRANTRLKAWTDRDSGMVKLYGEFDPERGGIVLTRLQAALDAQHALPVPPGCPDDPMAKNDHLRALALLHLLTNSDSIPTSNGGGGDEVDLVVVIDYDTLVNGIHDRSIIDAGHGVELPVETIRRMACCANIIPAILNSDGVLLELGRTVRLANRAQRRALRAMYPTCGIDGCSTRFEHCKVHHILWWDRDLGPTDIDNLIPLCPKHHHLAHEGRWQLDLHPTSRVLTVTYPDGTTSMMHPPRRRRSCPQPKPEPEPPPDLTLRAS